MPTPPSGPVSESSFLNPGLDENDYYVLRDATVYWESNGKMASLLSLQYSDAPMRIVGRPFLEREQLAYLVNKPQRLVDTELRIELRDVHKFAWGKLDDGSTALWAQGSTGWFLISPSRSYKDILREQLEAVDILMFIGDIRGTGKKGGNASAQMVFQEYAEDERFPACTDAAEAERIFVKHKDFLIGTCYERKEGITWSMPIVQYLKKLFPEQWQTAKAWVETKSLAEQNKKAPAKTRSAPAKSTARTKKPGKKLPSAPKKDDNWWGAAALFAFMQKAVNLDAMRIGHITIEKVAKLIVKRYEIDEFETARNILIAHAENLQHMMDHPKRKNTEYFTSEPIYSELSADHNLSAADIRRALMVELRPRNDHTLLNSDMDTSSESDASSSLETQTPKRQPRHKKHGRLSVLRPKSSKFSGKGKTVRPPAKGRGKGKAPVEDSDDEQAASDSEMDIDTPTHALLPAKRKHISDTTVVPSRKRAASTTLSNPSDSKSKSPPSSPSTNSYSNSADESQLPLQWRARNRKSSTPSILPVIVKTPLPTYTANGPGDSWICTFDGCSQKIYGASTELGRGLIEEHVGDHARGKVGEVDLVMQEKERLRLPVNNLLKRIREMSERQEQLFPNGGVGQPGPIERVI